jgi:hypothetical protein
MEFDVLKDLLRVINKNKSKDIELLGNGESRMQELYAGLSSGTFKSDDFAAKKLFNDSAHNPSYRKLRLRLIKQLINTAFFMDSKQAQYSERTTALNSCYRDFAAANILLSNDAGLAGTYLLNLVLIQCQKYEFTELAAEITRMLRMRYTRTLGDPEGHRKMSALHRAYEKKRRFEILALDYFEEVSQHYSKSRAPNPEVAETAAAYFEELYPQIKEVDTYNFYYYTYIIGIIRYFAVNDNQKVLDLCEEALDLLVNRKVTHKTGVYTIASQKMSCLTQLRRTTGSEGDEVFAFCKSLIASDGTNWIILHYSYLHFLLFAQRYTDALATYALIKESPRFHLMTGLHKDMLALFPGYFHLLAAFNKLDKTAVEALTGPFEANIFSSSFEVLHKEKEGMNIPIVLLPYLIKVVEADVRGAVVEEFRDALDVYRKRYLLGDLNVRSSSFIKLLFAFCDQDNNPKFAQKRIEQEWAALTAAPLPTSQQSFAIEIIPYEDLWQMLNELKPSKNT